MEPILPFFISTSLGLLTRLYIVYPMDLDVWLCCWILFTCFNIIIYKILSLTLFVCSVRFNVTSPGHNVSIWHHQWEVLWQHQELDPQYWGGWLIAHTLNMGKKYINSAHLSETNLSHYICTHNWLLDWVRISVAKSITIHRKMID